MINTPHLKADGLLTLDSLMRLIDEGVIKWWNDQQTNTEQKIQMHPFKSDYVKDLTNSTENRDTNRIVTFRKIKLSPGGMGQSPFSGIKEHRARLRENNVTSPNGEHGIIKGKWIDILTLRRCWRGWRRINLGTRLNGGWC